MKWVKIAGDRTERTDAMAVGDGVLVKTSQWYDVGVSEALCFIPNVYIIEDDESTVIVERKTGRPGPR